MTPAAAFITIKVVYSTSIRTLEPSYRVILWLQVSSTFAHAQHSARDSKFSTDLHASLSTNSPHHRCVLPACCTAGTGVIRVTSAQAAAVMTA
jgi:hypothetical protein